MSKNKYYKIVEKTERSGEKHFTVYRTFGIIGIIFKAWDEYTLKNESLQDAIEHIERIHSCDVVNDKEVYRTSSKELNNKNK